MFQAEQEIGWVRLNPACHSRICQQAPGNLLVLLSMTGPQLGNILLEYAPFGIPVHWTLKHACGNNPVCLSRTCQQGTGNLLAPLPMTGPQLGDVLQQRVPFGIPVHGTSKHALGNNPVCLSRTCQRRVQEICWLRYQ